MRTFKTIGTITKKILGNPNRLNSHNHRKSLNNKGFTLLELSIAIAIFATISSGVAVPVIGNYLSNLENRRSVQANAILTESWEAARAIRNRDWDALADGTHGLRFFSGQWEFFGASDIDGEFTRVITVSTPSRDPSGQLVGGGGVPDPQTKAITLRISWQPPYSEVRSLTATGLLTHYQNPGPWPIP